MEWGYFQLYSCNFRIVSFFLGKDFILLLTLSLEVDCWLDLLLFWFAFSICYVMFYFKVWLWSCFPFDFILF